MNDVIFILLPKLNNKKNFTQNNALLKDSKNFGNTLLQVEKFCAYCLFTIKL